MKKTIEEFKTRFRMLKKNIRGGLEKQRVPVDQVADSLTLLSPSDDDDYHKLFAESHVSDLFKADNIAEQFGTMNSHWNYLDPSLLDHLVRDFNLEEVKGEMETYKSDLGQFRKKTPLTLFCWAQKRKRVRLSPEFQEVVAEFDWRNDVTLEVVEQFRQEYASHYLTTSGTVSEDVGMWRWSSWSGMEGYSLSLSGTGRAASSSWCSGAVVRV